MNEPSAGGVGLEPEEAPADDGRRRRRQQSRRHILRALADALSEPDFELTPEQIAVRSGYSVSTIFRHFGGREELIAEMRKLLQARVGAILAAGPYEGGLRARVAELVRRLSAAFEMVFPILRTVHKNMGDTGRRRLDVAVRAEIEAALAEELAGLPAEATNLLATLLSVDSWSHMRRVHGQSEARAAALLESAVLRLLGEPTAW